MTIPIHPEAVGGDPTCVVWHTPPLPISSGWVTNAPGELGQLFENRTLTAGLVARGLVWLWLADGHSWRIEGSRVREALQEALELPESWASTPAGAVLIEKVTEHVLQRLDTYINSHGGAITVAGVTDDTVELSFAGACSRCPAAGVTLHQRIEAGIRERVSTPITVREGSEPRRGLGIVRPSAASTSGVG